MSATVSPEVMQNIRSKSRRRVRAWLKRGLFGLVIAVVVLGGAGAVYQAFATGRDLRKFLPPGQFVDLDGRRIHLLVMGEQTGQPTVILEAGIASFSSNWAWVQTELAGSTRVVAVDRAGLGWSDPADEPQDAQQSAIDLHTALQKAGLPGPYVIAGHSYGGLVVRAFAGLYPQDVAGMVLVDASHPDQWTRIPASKGGRTVAAANQINGYLARLGFFRLFNLNAPLIAGLPDRPAAEMTAFLARPQAWTTSSGVLSIWDSRTRPQIDQSRSLGDLPLAVISVTEQALYGEELTALQAELPALSSNSMHLTVEGATHESLISRREHARVVADVMLRVIEAAQTGKPLAQE